MDGFSSFFAILMLCAGVFLTVRINFFQFTHLGCAIKTALGLGQRRAAENVRRKQKSDASGVTPFQALSSALGGSIGTANIAGVASAIAIGGAGAVFYMWLAALVGMGVKFCEIVLALRYREKRGGQWCGGAMLYIEKGFRKSNTGSRFLQSVSKPLAAGFALFGLLASSVGTPLVQSNTIAMSVNDAVLLFLPKAEQKTVCIIAGAATAALVGIVILGGIQRIGKASEIIVPFMAIGYIAICIIVLSRFGGRILPAFCDIFSSALGIKQAVGGAAGFVDALHAAGQRLPVPAAAGQGRIALGGAAGFCFQRCYLVQTQQLEPLCRPVPPEPRLFFFVGQLGYLLSVVGVVDRWLFLRTPRM